MNMSRNIILCGLPMCGKTTLGKQIAEKLSWNFIDTDQLLEEAYAYTMGKTLSCRQIFSCVGEAVFRALEREQILALDGVKESVIAVGGGALCDPENITVLQRIGTLVYLKISVEQLLVRMAKCGVPAYISSVGRQKISEEFQEMANKRMPVYESAAAVIIDQGCFAKQQTRLLAPNKGIRGLQGGI